MPIAGLGLHMLLALFCAVHVVRSGQQLYWLFILFAFPLLGSVVYFLAVYLPNSRLERGAMRAIAAAAHAIDPQRSVREARARFDETPTVQNQMQLATALLENEQAEEAAKRYEDCLKGHFANDLDVRLGAARAFVECQRYVDALRHIETIRTTNPDYCPDQIALLIARAYVGTERPREAREEFESAIARFGTFESYAEYEIWTLAIGDNYTANRLQKEIDKMTQRWNSMARQLNDSAMRRLTAAQALAAKRYALQDKQSGSS